MYIMNGTIDSKDLTFLEDGKELSVGDFLFDPGSITMWYGEVREIPKGWIICDGRNGPLT